MCFYAKAKALYRLFAHDVIAVARNAAGGQEVIFLHRNQ